MNIGTLFVPGQLGQMYEKNGKKYQLVQFKSSSSTIANGCPVMWTDRANFVVSAKVSDSKRNEVAGVALGAITAGNYDFIQVRGNHSAVITGGGGGSAGDVYVMNSSDGTSVAVTAGTAPTYIPLGVAAAAESASAVSLDLCPPLNGA
jgi:hypothetical protein